MHANGHIRNKLLVVFSIAAVIFSFASSFGIYYTSKASEYGKQVETEYYALTAVNAELTRRLSAGQNELTFRENNSGTENIDDNQSDKVVSALMEYTGKSRLVFVGMAILAFIIGISLALWLSAFILKNIVVLKSAADQLSKGDLDVEIDIQSRDEFGALADSLRFIAESLLIKAKLASQIGFGDLSHDVELASENDKLGLALQQMVLSLRNKVEFAQQIAQGSLQKTLNLSSSDDLLGQTLQIMIDNLNTMIRQIVDTAESLSESASSIHGTSQDLSQATNEQAASLQEISSSMEELDGQTRSNLNKARQANERGNDSKLEAEYGHQRMVELQSAMGEISSVSDQITAIIKTIDEIAFQTNVLAINAAVEAARAGEHGRGFAVVAEEVRNLAQRSAKASKETTRMILSSIKKIETGVAVADNAAQSLDKIKNNAVTVTDLIQGIVESSNEQALGVSQVNQGTSQLNLVVQKNADIAEQCSKTGALLDHQAGTLKQLVSRFSLSEKPNESRNQKFKIVSEHSTTQLQERLTKQKQDFRQLQPTQTEQNSLHEEQPEDMIQFGEEDLGRF